MGSWYLPEVIRLNGQLRLLDRDADGAENLWREALASAQHQGSLFWELRVANDLAQLWMVNGKCDQARSLLGGVLSRFSDRQAIDDILLADSLLEKLNSQNSGA
jgi:predicted ATPase